MKRLCRCVLMVACAVGGAVPSWGQSLNVFEHAETVPQELAAPVRDRLVDGGTRVERGETIIELWWVESMPLTQPADDGDPSWAAVEEGSLVGAVRLSDSYRDIRGRTIPAGLYTLRLGIQPDNGDHIGISPNREFLLLNPIAEDTGPEPIAHNDLIEVSKLTVGVSHPAVWSLDPLVTDAEVMTVEITDDGFESVVAEVPVKHDGATAGRLRFGLVLIGRIEA